MKRLIAVAVAGLLIAIAVALADPPPSAVATLDIRKSSQRQFDLRIAESTDSKVRFYLVENAVAWTNAAAGAYTGALAFATAYTSTPVSVAAGTADFGVTNYVDFDLTAAQATAGTYVAQITLVETSTARRVQWGRGALVIEQGF